MSAQAGPVFQASTSMQFTAVTHNGIAHRDRNFKQPLEVRLLVPHQLQSCARHLGDGHTLSSFLGGQ